MGSGKASRSLRSVKALGTFASPLSALLIAWLPAACGSDPAAPSGHSNMAPDDPTNSDVVALLARSDNEAKRIRQVIVFGDSLSDVGTYDVGAIADAGGGKFTTNPGPVWPEIIGAIFNAPVKPFRQGLAGSSRVLGGTGFAMGGARVSQQPGINCNPDPVTAACTAWLTIPVRQQIDDYLSANNDPTADKLVFILAGANDVFFQLGAFQAKMQAGVPLEQAQAEALSAMQQTATELVEQVRRIDANDATRVIVLNVPDMSETPFGKAPTTAPVRPLIAGMVTLFNATLASGLETTTALLFDLEAELQRVIANPDTFHVLEVDTPACDAAKIAAVTNGLEQGGSSLLCSRQTLVRKDAPFTFLFADSVHPSTLGHLIISRFVLAELRKRGVISR